MVKQVLATSILLAGISLPPAMQQPAEAECVKVQVCVTKNGVRVCTSVEKCGGGG